MRTLLSSDDDRPSTHDATALEGLEAGTQTAVAGFVPFFARPGVIVTNEFVDRLRDEEGI